MVFPELSLTGYLLKDLVNDVSFLDTVLKFKAEEEPTIFEFKGEKLGILICEDAWRDDIPNILSTRERHFLLLLMLHHTTLISMKID